MAALEDCITRTHDNGDKHSIAVYSSCENYRYSLRREWGSNQALCYVMLNPSTASELKNDPTIERCERRARALGFGAFEVVNIFALRATNPKMLYRHRDPVGPLNDTMILNGVQSNDQTLVAWGAHGRLHNRAQEVHELLKGHKLFHIGLTKAGEPRHPLYVAYSQKPVEWRV